MVLPPRKVSSSVSAASTGTSTCASRMTCRGDAPGRSSAYTFLASIVAEVVSSIEPGTSAVSIPVTPIRPTNQGANASRDSRSSARSESVPLSPGTFSTAAKPTKKMKSSTSW